MIFFSVNLIHAQETEKKIRRSDCKHHVGLTGGSSIGYGLSYLYQMKKIGVQATFSPYINHTDFNTSVALTGLYQLIEGKNTDLMLYLSGQYILGKYEYHDEFTSSESEDIVYKGGLGLAYQMFLSPKYKICFYTGYSFTYKDSYNIDYYYASSDKSIGVYPDGGVSLYFMF